VMGNWRNRSIPSIGTPSQKLNSAYLIEHGSGHEGCSWVAPGREELESGRESPRPDHFCLLYSTWPKNPGVKMVSVRLM
jgi:hypothetical protein